VSLEPGISNPRLNHLLAVLPKSESERLFPYLESVSLSLGEALNESGDRLNHVYFPTTAIVSLLYVLENGASAEIAVVGNEGIVGIALFMGGGAHSPRAGGETLTLSSFARGRHGLGLVDERKSI
jgi:hypothetical protein